jgi:hypothetical protein
MVPGLKGTQPHVHHISITFSSPTHQVVDQSELKAVTSPSLQVVHRLPNSPRACLGDGVGGVLSKRIHVLVRTPYPNHSAL